MIAKFQRLPSADGLSLPAYATAGAVGLDLPAAADLSLAPGERKLIPTGFAVELPAGSDGQVRPRSGLALRHGVTVLNAPGTIDPDYRGEIKVLLVNHGTDTVILPRGTRIAQLVIAPASRAEVTTAETLPDSERGAGGFGSTDVMYHGQRFEVAFEDGDDTVTLRRPRDGAVYPGVLKSGLTYADS